MSVAVSTEINRRYFQTDLCSYGKQSHIIPTVLRNNRAEQLQLSAFPHRRVLQPSGHFQSCPLDPFKQAHALFMGIPEVNTGGVSQEWSGGGESWPCFFWLSSGYILLSGLQEHIVRLYSLFLSTDIQKSSTGLFSIHSSLSLHSCLGLPQPSARPCTQSCLNL